MAKIRVNRRKGYTIMSNYHLKDKTLSLKAKGLLSIMLSLPDEWHYSTKGLAAICKEGVDAVSSAIKELEKSGYVIRNKIRDARGRIAETEYIIYEEPQNKNKSESAPEPKEKEDLSTGEEQEQKEPEHEEPKHEEPKHEEPKHEEPKQNEPKQNEPKTDFPCTVNAEVESSDVDNSNTESPRPTKHAQLSTKELSTKESNTNILNTQSINQSINKTDEKIPTKASPKEDGWIDRTAEYRSLIMDNIDYNYLVDKYDCERIDEIVEIILDAVCTRKKYIRVDGDEKSAELVKSRLLKLGPFHIDYAFDCLRKNTTKVYNIKAYLLTTLYNASATMGHYYSAEVNHDLYGS